MDMGAYTKPSLKNRFRRLAAEGVSIPAGADIQKSAAVLLLSALACGAFCVFDELNPSLGYFQAAWIKQVLLLSTIFVYSMLYREPGFFHRMLRRNGGLNAVKPGLFWGVLALIVILGGASVYGLLFNTNALEAQINSASKSTADFLPVALYIVFINTLLEEIFFRGFVFLTVYRNGSPVFAYAFSSLLFAVYHSYIFSTKFPIGLVLLAMAGLSIAGFMLSRLNVRANNIYNSYLTHALASAGIMLIGLYVYGYFG